MMTGALVLLAGVLAAVAMTATQVASWMVTAPIWVIIGGGMAIIVTPTGRVIRGSVAKQDLPAGFAAQFSLSHLAWLVTYPIAAHLLWPREQKDSEAAPTGVAAAEPVISDRAVREETEAAEGTLAACQCACVRTV